MSGTRQVILHYHIFKNAGSTLAAALARNFPTSFASFDTPHHNKRIQPQELVAFVQNNPHLVAISSHHLRPPAPRLDGVQFHEILILRDPLDRLRSMYDFYRRVSVNDDPLTREAKRLDVQQFFRHVLETSPNVISNAQLNLVANGGARIPNQDDVTRGIAMLSDMATVGVAEQFDECAVATEVSLRTVFPNFDLSYAPENVSPGRANALAARLRSFSASCGVSLYERLQEANRLDEALVKAAAAESSRRFGNIPNGENHLRDFTARVNRRKLLYAKAKRRLTFARLWNRATRLITQGSSR